jgi:regulator of nucleoside diphosphate kinase
VRLVLPFEADMEAGRMSILTPVGAGLIGLTVGQSIDWNLPDGRPRVLKILAVEHTP